MFIINLFTGENPAKKYQGEMQTYQYLSQKFDLESQCEAASGFEKLYYETQDQRCYEKALKVFQDLALYAETLDVKKEANYRCALLMKSQGRFNWIQYLITAKEQGHEEAKNELAKMEECSKRAHEMRLEENQKKSEVNSPQETISNNNNEEEYRGQDENEPLLRSKKAYGSIQKALKEKQLI